MTKEEQKIKMEALKDLIADTKNQVAKNLEQAKFFKEQAIKNETELVGLNKAFFVITNGDNKPESRKLKLRKSCRGSARVVYETMAKMNKPLKPAVICKITNINANTVHGIIRNGYTKRGVIEKVGEGLYKINQKGINLLDITK
jgi:hypothetical protein